MEVPNVGFKNVLKSSRRTIRVDKEAEFKAKRDLDPNVMKVDEVKDNEKKPLEGDADFIHDLFKIV